MATFYIDPNRQVDGDGSETNPFITLASLPTLSAGDVINLKPGSTLYLSSGYTFTGSGTLGNPIIFRTDPSDSLNKATIKITTTSLKALSYTSRSYITTENIIITGEKDWLVQTSNAFFINGAGNGLIFNNCDAQYVAVGFVGTGGFNRNGITLNNCTATYCTEDGVRMWPGTTNTTWENISIIGGTFSNNGTAKGGNGSGIIFYKYEASYEPQIFKNVLIDSVVCNYNYVHGIALIDAYQYPILGEAANTTPPSHKYNGLIVRNCISSYNGGGGITLSCISPSDTFPLLIENNTCWYNSWNTTLGSIWTGACLTPVIQKNNIQFTRSNGTTVGDGEGIFDDQWNEGAIVRWNIVANGVFNTAQNPEYTAYGIGIYRSTKGKHYGNIIINCRYGYIIGQVPTATHPVMEDILVSNNTFISTKKKGIALWAALPSSCVTIVNNCFIDCESPMEAHSAQAGTQTISNNWSYLASIESDGANIPDGGNLFSAVPLVNNNYAPLTGSSLIAAGTYTEGFKDFNEVLFQNPPSVGAFEYVRPRTAATTRTMRS